ncbi:MAG TPA: FAD-binding protein [Mycobacterium sp.]|nr:FAD-binding protein [Mycobacterium sp.]HTX93983.1 FAD-binding protein [Mycobacterium sp.]
MTEMRADLLSPPGSDGYRAATNPHNATVVQRPAMVAHPRRAEEVAHAIQWAAQRWGLAVQASGHGAGAPIEADRMVVDTSGLNALRIDAQARLAHVGAGATWSAVNALAERDGLLGLAGTSPTVAVAGYTFGGGLGFLIPRIGWPVRRYWASTTSMATGNFGARQRTPPTPSIARRCGRFAVEEESAWPLL